MGKDFESWLHQRQPDGQFPHAKSLKLPVDLGMQNPDISCAIPCTDAVPPNCTLPPFGFSGVPSFTPGQFKDSHGWFHCLPRFRQGLMPDMTLQEKFVPKTDLPGKVPPAANAAKQFLVFDQTGSKTTMILSTGISTPFQQLGSLSPKSPGFYNVGSNGYNHSGLSLTEWDEDYDTHEGSEMREDTEEINALLYSDDEDSYSEDGDEASTGHSPSTMTAYEKQDWFEEEDMDEVASSTGPSKRQKLSDIDYEVPSITNCSTSVKPSSEYEDDAESSCAGGQQVRCSNTGSLSGNKRLRKEKIRETVSVLQTIIPGGKDKDAVMVLDEAINYLRTLKFKVRSLGLAAQ